MRWTMGVKSWAVKPERTYTRRKLRPQKYWDGTQGPFKGVPPAPECRKEMDRLRGELAKAGVDYSVIAWTRPYGQRWRVSTYRTLIGIRLGGF